MASFFLQTREQQEEKRRTRKGQGEGKESTKRIQQKDKDWRRASSCAKLEEGQDEDNKRTRRETKTTKGHGLATGWQPRPSCIPQEGQEETKRIETTACHRSELPFGSPPSLWPRSPVAAHHSRISHPQGVPCTHPPPPPRSRGRCTADPAGRAPWPSARSLGNGKRRETERRR